jgi:hypothetical protein
MASRTICSNSLVVAMTLTLLASCQASQANTSSHAAFSHYGPRDAAAFKPTLESAVLGALAGHDAAPLPGQEGVLNGADLGWAFSHRDKLWIMFGDSWWRDPFNLVGLPDDALGQISLTDFPDGVSVDAYVRAHPAPAGAPAWRAGVPQLDVANNRARGFAPVISEQDGRQLRSGIGAVPIVAFSNGRDDAAEGVFAVFFPYEPVACRAGTCPDGYACDAQVGRLSTGALTPPCVGGSSSSCVVDEGLCQDRMSNRYDATTNRGRTTSVLMQHAVGVTKPDDPTHFQTQPWATMRFLNATGRTVSDFDPARAHGDGNDYKPALGNELERSGVFIWGRPHFGGVASEGRDLRLYLLWVPMPAPDSSMQFAWNPRFFTGLDPEGRPQFSDRELDAHALDLDAETDGEQPEELHDFAGHMNMSWVPSLQQFVMFYGGDVPGFSEGLLAWDDPDKIEHDPKGSLWVRFAPQPWGPWTAPRMLLEGGDRSTAATPALQYGPGGILAHNRCTSADCAHYDTPYLLDIGRNNNGLLYAPSIIDAWTTASDESTALYWLVSTWNPYQVYLMKTVLLP